MSFLGATLGIGSTASNSAQGGSGINYQAGSAPIDKPTTVDQTNQAYGTAQQGLQNQAAFLAALQGQNGVQNQSSVFNQQQAVANGQGPNPAQAMLAQSTANNVAQQGALMGSQRGAGANSALLARQVAQQGAQTQQQSAGQAATLQANQSLNALNQLGGIAQNQVGNQAAATTGYSQAAQSEQQNLLNGIQGQNNAAVSNQASQNSANSGLAQKVTDGQQGITGGLMSSAGSALGLAGMAEGGAVRPMFADGGEMEISASPMPGYKAPDPNAPQSAAFGHLYGSAPSNTNAAQAPIQTQEKEPPATTGAGALKKGTEGLFKGISKGLSGAQAAPMQGTPMGGGMMAGAGEAEGAAAGAGGALAEMAPLVALAARGGKVPALVSPGERYLPPSEVDKVAQGKKSPMKAGEKIPGKPQVAGDKNSYANDTVPKTLEEGGIVLPRSVTQSKDPAKAAHAFVSAIINKQKRKGMR